MKVNFDKHRNAKPLSPLAVGARAYIPDRKEEGVVTSRDERTYQIETPFRRNRRMINSMPEVRKMTVLITIIMPLSRDNSTKKK